MRRFISILRFQLMANRSFIWFAGIISILGLLFSIGRPLSMSSNLNNRLGHSISFFSPIIWISLFYFAAAIPTGYLQAFQMSVRSGAARGVFLKGSISFYTILSFVWSGIIVAVLAFENLMSRAAGVKIKINLYGLQEYSSLDLSSVLNMFIFIFSLYLGLAGLIWYVNAALSTVLKGKLLLIACVLTIFAVYLAAVFTQLQLHALNFLMNNSGITFHIKLVAVGFGGMIFSWPFLERMDIDRLRY